VLDQFDALMKTDAPKEKVQAVVEAMRSSVDEVASDTERRLERFDREWGALRGQAADANTLRDLMDRLAELGQELLQPLTVINCVLNMLASGGTEVIPETSRDMVNLANESGNRMRDLMQRLLDIVGLPRSLTPEFERIYGPEGKPAGI
jgi:signal transduction histidine kinase